MNAEFIAVIDYWVREKGIEKATLLSAVQDCLVGAAKKALGPARDLRCEINPKTGEIKAFAKLLVVEKVEDARSEISLLEARINAPEAQCGDEIEKEVTPHDFGRIAAQHAKQNLIQLIRRIEKSKIYSEFKDRTGDIVDGVVSRFEKGDVLVDLGKYEALMPSRERVPSENYEVGERLHFYIKSVENRQNGPEIILSRADAAFVLRLFEIEISEIKDGTIEVKGIAREPGVRTKIAVYSKDSKVDPVGACVGIRGQRVKNIVRELNNEKIDIIKYDEDITRYVSNALAPAKLKSYEVVAAQKYIHVWTTEDQLSLAIGRRGQNARLTSQLTGWRIDIDAEEPEPTGFDALVANAISDFVKIPSITEEQAELLVRSGFTSANAVLHADLADLEAIEGIGESAKEIVNAVREESERVSLNDEKN
ncbi:MAG: transcription termination factor NusA [Limisphaerales bacterium]|jgi:N utilization substance protein A|nr:transcription termination factor NusA [Verrucomicrobiota bacterium]